eukprot:scaffold269_cov404-Prasinococcus_capsulatus_cf.AAC.48
MRELHGVPNRIPNRSWTLLTWYYSKRRVWIPNTMNRMPPARATLLSEMEVANARPPRTAAPVQKACPTMPPAGRRVAVG